MLHVHTADIAGSDEVVNSQAAAWTVYAKHTYCSYSDG